MRRSQLAVVALFTWSACSDGPPSTPSPGPPPTPVTFVISGTVYESDASGRRPLVAATVELADATTGAWGQYGRPVTDGSGRYTSGPLTARHYLARASRNGYEGSAIVTLGYVEAARTLDFELVSLFATNAPLSVASLAPAAGSSGGGTSVRIAGAGFQQRATVTFGGASANIYVENSSVIHAIAPSRTAGAVDVVVTNPDGQTARSTYTYAPPGSFDFNGTWTGYALAHPELESRIIATHSDMDFRLTIQNNTVTTATCGGATITIPPPGPSVSNGEFSLPEAAMTGKLLSAAEAGGAINTPACPATRWNARKQ